MKNFGLLILSCLFLPVVGVAQLSFSPVVGASVSKSKFTGLDIGTSPALRYFIGVQSAYHFSEKMSAGLSLQLATKGYTDQSGEIGFIDKAYYQYFEINPFIEFKPLAFIGVLAGGNIGFNTQYEYYSDGTRWSPGLGLNEKMNYEALIAIKFYRKNAFVSLGFSQSIIPIYDLTFTDDMGNNIGTMRQYHQNFLLSLGYNFHLKKK